MIKDTAQTNRIHLCNTIININNNIHIMCNCTICPSPQRMTAVSCGAAQHTTTCSDRIPSAGIDVINSRCPQKSWAKNMHSMLGTSPAPKGYQYYHHSLLLVEWNFCYGKKKNQDIIQQNSIYRTRKTVDGCQIVKYSGLSDDTYTDLSSYR